jgi:hypothetical protein
MIYILAILFMNPLFSSCVVFCLSADEMGKSNFFCFQCIESVHSLVQVVEPVNKLRLLSSVAFFTSAHLYLMWNRKSPKLCYVG